MPAARGRRSSRVQPDLRWCWRPSGHLHRRARHVASASASPRKSVQPKPCRKPARPEWLKVHAPQGGRIGHDPWLHGRVGVAGEQGAGGEVVEAGGRRLFGAGHHQLVDRLMVPTTRTHVESSCEANPGVRHTTITAQRSAWVWRGRVIRGGMTVKQSHGRGRSVPPL